VAFLISIGRISPNTVHNRADEIPLAADSTAAFSGIPLLTPEAFVMNMQRDNQARYS